WKDERQIATHGEREALTAEQRQLPRVGSQDIAELSEGGPGAVVSDLAADVDAHRPERRRRVGARGVVAAGNKHRDQTSSDTARVHGCRALWAQPLRGATPGGGGAGGGHIPLLGLRRGG